MMADLEAAALAHDRPPAHPERRRASPYGQQFAQARIISPRCGLADAGRRAGTSTTGTSSARGSTSPHPAHADRDLLLIPATPNFFEALRNL